MTTTTPRSFKVGVKTKGDRDWVSNALRFATQEAAEAWGAGLARRWVLVEQWTVLPSDDEPTD